MVREIVKKSTSPVRIEWGSATYEQDVYQYVRDKGYPGKSVEICGPVECL